MGVLSVALLCLVLIVSHEVDAQVTSTSTEPPEIPGILIWPPVFQFETFSRALSAPQSCQNQYGAVCADCNTIWTCAGSDQPVAVQNCNDFRPGRPLCYNNACVATVPADSQCSSHLTCTGEGYFPNPTNCSQYYYCEEASLTAASKVYECPVGYSYNTYTTRCRWGTDCKVVDCYEQANQFVAHPENSIYYAFCTIKLGVSTPIMFRCPNDNLNHTFFDEETLKCEFQCPSEGRFIDNQDENAFFECLYVYTDEPPFGYWLSTRQTCPVGLVFDGYRQSCTKRYQLPIN